MICGANVPHLQPIAELQRNQRGEIGRQHVKAHSNCSHFSPCSDHTSPTQTNDGTSQIDHDIGAYVPYSFRTMSRVLLRPLPTEVQGWRRQGQRLNVMPTAQWRDHLNRERGFTASMISPVCLRPWLMVRQGFELATSRSAYRRSSNWANRAVNYFLPVFFPNSHKWACSLRASHPYLGERSQPQGACSCRQNSSIGGTRANTDKFAPAMYW